MSETYCHQPDTIFYIFYLNSNEKTDQARPGKKKFKMLFFHIWPFFMLKILKIEFTKHFLDHIGFQLYCIHVRYQSLFYRFMMHAKTLFLWRYLNC
jgi:hypothetical protein